ncbi:ABC transporter permease [Brassicibacter mesophilus]|uniref:ABC transporter permease n=1 Tax=Brassicibacter mesophilus TaxID=745119 RepID=UPI003D204B96
MNKFLGIIFSTQFFYSILRVATPILFASMGAVVANTAGIANIALEGIMLISAFTGVFISAATGSAGIGLLGAVIAGILFAAVLAFFTLYYRTNVFLGGIAINSLASGGTIFLLYLLTGDKGSSTSIASKVIPEISIPIIRNIPVIGDIFSGHNILTYLSLLSIAFVYILIKKTALGYHLRAVGENQNAAESVGINVIKTKAIALLLSGMLAGLGGAFMSMGYVSSFSRDMVSGRGWIAIAAEAMGKTNPIATAITSLLFGAADAVSNAAAAVGWASDIVQTIPYIATIIGLLIFSRREMKKMKL